MDREHARRVYDFQDLQRRVPLTAVLERYGVLAELKRSGRQLVGRCPIHKGTNPKQFLVDPKKNVWRCFGDCDRGGSTLELIVALEGVAISEAAELIARWFAIAPSRTSASQQSQRSERRHNVSNSPSHKVFAVEDRAEEDGDESKAWWTRIGSAFPHKDGKGLNIVLSALPINARIVLREFDPEEAKKEEEQKGKRKK